MKTMISDKYWTCRDQASNEGSLKFTPIAHLNMLDTGGITFEDAVKEGVTTDFEEVFKHVAEHELEKYVKKSGKSADAAQPLNISDMPGVGTRLLFADIANGLIPTAISRENVTIIVNKNLVKIMCMLKRMGLNGMYGDIFGTEEDREYAPLDNVTHKDDRTEPFMGNVYKGIIYGIAIHEIRGHFRILKNKLVFEPDDKLAQGQRGTSMLYFNLAALLWFYLEVVEDRTGFDQERIKSFFKTNGIMFKKFVDDLTDEMKRLRINDLLALYRNVSTTLKENGILFDELERISILGKAPAGPKNFVTANGNPHTPDTVKKPEPVPEPAEQLPSPALVFKKLAEAKKNHTVTTICGEFSKNYTEIVQKILEILKKLALIKDARVPGGAITNLKSVPLTATEKQLVVEILESMDNNGETEININEKRTALANTIDPVWKKMFINTIEKAAQVKDAIVPGKKIVIAMETDWVPEPQKKHINNLVDTLKESLGQKPKCIIMHSANTFLGKNLIKAIVNKKVVPRNLIVLADEQTLKQEEFKKIRDKFAGSEKSPFIIAVRSADIPGDAYIRLMEMLTRGVQLAFSLDAPSVPPAIMQSKIVNRYCVFKPKVQPVSNKELEF